MQAQLPIELTTLPVHGETLNAHRPSANKKGVGAAGGPFKPQRELFRNLMCKKLHLQAFAICIPLIP